MPDIIVNEILKLATSALRGQGFPADAAADVAEELIVAELAGVKTHGLGKLVSLNLGDLSAQPIIKERGALLSIDGQKGNGFLLFRRIADLIADRCSTTGIAAAFAHNFSRYSSLYPYTIRIARRGLVGILTNTAGPAAVTPYGSIDPITGTNPICFSFPTGNGEAQTFDFATSEVVWGEIRQAALEGRALKSDAFINAAGDVASTPADVNAVRAFGGSKGWALNLAIEIFAGLLSGGRAGLEVNSEFDCGAVLIAIDPRATGLSSSIFAERVAALLRSIRSSRSESASVPVRCPGDRGRSMLSLSDRTEEQLQIPEATIQMLQRMTKGEKISELASNPLFN